MRDDETVEFETARTMLSFDVAREGGEHLEIPDADFERESLDLEEIQLLQRRTPESKRKSTYRDREGASPIRVSH